MRTFLIEEQLRIRIIRLLWLVSMAVVVYLSLVPSFYPPLDVSNLDKVSHFLAYLWLALLPPFAFLKSQTARACSVSMIGLGLALEIGQYFVPGRHFSGLDILANTLGVGLGLWFGLKIRLFVSFASGKADK